MAHKGLFAPAGKAPQADSKNQAGGRAYAFSAEHALAQYAATGTFHGTFYASEKDQLDKVLELASKVSPEFVAKTAVFARERGYMKDMPAFLAAYLAAKDVRLLAAIFPRVVDGGKMLRNFVQIVRSGVVGRKSFGTAPKRLAQRWFKSRSPEMIFRQSVGGQPSMKDVIKMVRPSPKNDKGESDLCREALYGYLIGKDVAIEKLPPLVRAFEAFKKGEGPLPDVPFEMLTALELDTAYWIEIAKTMSWTQTRMNLNTLKRHGVLEHAEMVALVAERLRSPEAVRRARAFPYQLLAAYRAAAMQMPGEITMALQEALEVSIENVPSVSGKVFLCPDVSGSMQSPVTGRRPGATTSVRCIDIAALVAAAFLRRNTSAEVIPFSDDVVKMPTRLNPLDSITACSAPLRHLNERRAKGDLVVYVSDNMSWADFGSVKTGYGTRGTVMAEEWARFRARNDSAKLVLIDVQPYATTQVAERSDVLNVGGFSDAVFNVVSFFAKGELGADHWVGEVERVTL
jgi:60 kDa SS-A/Ro ribonucleoprotein